MVMVAVHPRTTLTEKAYRELELQLVDLQIKYSLTDAELMFIFARQLTNVSRGAIQMERHPTDPTKIGDEA